VVDLNASIGEGAWNYPALGEIQSRAKKKGARLQWGGGVRAESTLDQLLAAGVERVIVGTQAIENWAWLESTAERRPGKIMVSIDGKGRRVMVRGWQAESGVDAVDFVRRADSLSIAGYLYTNVSVEGKGEGVDWGPVRDICEAAKKPVVFSGGVSSLEDVARFKELGAYGIIAGSALYRKRFQFKAAKALGQ
jgi:phosphoribosylformimino-5-aminoimidazole carboxamide ribotide isomerase